MVRNRRGFLKQLAGLASVGGLSYGGTTLWGQSSATTRFNDYKALVCIFLNGGNDSWNTVIPYRQAEYNAYSTARGGENTWGLAVPRDALLPIRAQSQGSDALNFGFHPSMQGLQRLYQEGSLAIVPNVGPLIKPTSLDAYRQSPVTRHPLPPQLGSHNDQQRQWETLKGTQAINSGWAGRMADTMIDAFSDHKLPANISLSGQNPLLSGELDNAYVMSPTGIVEIDGLFSGPFHEERRAAVTSIFDETLRSDSRSYYEKTYAKVRKRLMDYALIVNEAFEKAPSFPLLPDNLPNSAQLKIQLRTVAKLIAMRDLLGMSRQVFLVATSNIFDQHGRQMQEQPGLLADLSTSITGFHEAMRQLGIANEVTLFTQSDFGRTLTSNGDGSDHGWGGLHMIVGDGVRGGEMYGEYPALSLETELDIGGGVFIPSVSADQYAATMARWFGVNDNLLDYVAPNLRNFNIRDLGFMS